MESHPTNKEVNFSWYFCIQHVSFLWFEIQVMMIFIGAGLGGMGYILVGCKKDNFKLQIY
jgi:hypothetical protein